MPALIMPGQPDPSKILIFRALQLGDMLNVVPALRALRAAFPRANITLAGLPWAAGFAARFHTYLNGFIEFPGFPGLPEQLPAIGRIPAFLESVQALSADLALQMQGSGEISNLAIALWGAKKYAGFHSAGHYCPDTRYFMEYPEHEPEAWRHLRLMEFLEIPLQGDGLEFPLYDDDWNALSALQREHELGKRYVCIHPGARKAERRWPAAEFAKVADGLVRDGYQVVLTGSRDEATLTRSVKEKMNAPAIDLGGKTSLGALGALLSEAQLLVSNDTGISHLAAALKTPSVVLFAVPDLDRWAPLDRRLHKVLPRSLERSAGEVLVQTERHLEEVQEHAC